ncbi:MAG: DUF438 domain-containing protein [Bacteroidetes bacterium]|nr:DUF438 domain-containing protein [Bacteroidota bacterium]
MSELIDNSIERKKRLKTLILKLHEGHDEAGVAAELKATLGSIPYGEVVEVEQELIAEGLPEEEVLRLCDMHAAVLDGRIDLSNIRIVPEGHPVDVFRKENAALRKVAEEALAIIESLPTAPDDQLQGLIWKLRSSFNALIDADKHYQRKEYLLFPFLERMGITGPPKVMWGKHDEIRELLKGSLEVLQTEGITMDDLQSVSEMILIPAIRQVVDMTKKEEEILLPMALDHLTEADWYQIEQQTPEFGFCLYDPPVKWVPDWAVEQQKVQSVSHDGRVQLPTGSFSLEELQAILNTLPVDITFVDKHDKVKYFSQSADRIFQRNRAILNRDVRHCHPPASAHIVDKIVEDFRSGRASRAPFWINKGGRFIHIEYFALRNEAGEFLGTLEVSHDLTHYRSLEGEQRILNYSK